MEHMFYVDESGDLGWSFGLPYGAGGSSRYLVISGLSMPRSDDHRPERVMKNVYKGSKWDHKKEKKWIQAPKKSRLHFAQEALQLSNNCSNVQYYAIVVKKEKVATHLRDDGNKLYNYMIKLMLVDEMAKHAKVNFIPDPRSIKVESGNSMHDYLSIWLGFELRVATTLITQTIESKHSKNLQFADFMSGVVHSHFEFGRSEYFNLLSPKIAIKKLFF
ncbi:TPA: DUF3800 domain-containing protein [Xanthomonas vasicola pv. zeae]|uniref:Uncharacterized protein n=4 Tax=Xanthomonas vasicola TaxID=56459 RepID=A0A836P422_XANVA|nr:DUF3800 domain-containing protein [Xanthomonas vasicola]AVQ08006.1 DUF3800 domain-containing protein [Xanthomonas vasicola pv. vasculorum]AZM72205.1 DUF3800 domain-containing protein [Xanthomonas vasicola pv. vasculorum]KFA31112.1 hypothetical protein KW5_0103060 [Xanthomonas vasicola pv. vasculorum NCPPB 1326]KFA31438.1 hypothetical protein KWG_0110625 [Xanthomonas vasicola pv. vasculorum NCPPB 1381]MBV6748128.1 DUF3800 domain-containing protein [Xanthomonas vasicola pv. vasculorum NCPPB 8